MRLAGRAGAKVCAKNPPTYRWLDNGAAAASAAAFANPWSASIGAFKDDLGKVSSDSSSDDGAVEGTIPYVANLCGGGAKPGSGGNFGGGSTTRTGSDLSSDGG